MNCAKCQKPIYTGQIAVRFSDQSMAHAECDPVRTQPLGVVTQVKPLSHTPQCERDPRDEEWTCAANCSKRTVLQSSIEPSQGATPLKPILGRSVVIFDGLEYFVDSVAFDANGKMTRGEAVSCVKAPVRNITPQPTDVWLQTYLGRQLRVPEWNHDAITLEETAYVLSGINRFGARTSPLYSVAEHSVRVADCIRELGGTVAEQWSGINHEGDEALLGFDPPAPLLRLLPDLRELKHKAHVSYCRRYSLPVEMPAIVKHADLILLATEKRDLMRLAPASWMKLPDPLPGKISPWPNPYARFVAKWRELAVAVGFEGRE